MNFSQYLSDRPHLLYRLYWQVMKRDGKCQSCSLPVDTVFEENNKPTPYGYNGISYILMTIDHIYPKSLGGKFELSNLQVLCQPCNNKKSNTV